MTIYALMLWAALAAPAVLDTAPSSTPPATGPAFTLSLDGGANLFNHGDGWGGGFNAYPGLVFDNGLSPELQFGFHAVTTTLATFKNGSVTSRRYIVPLYVGVRYEMGQLLALGPVKPFLALHVGPAVVRGVSPSGKVSVDAQFGFNMGAGFDYGVCRAFGLGASVWYDFVNQPNGGDIAWLSLGLNARYHFGFDSASTSP